MSKVSFPINPQENDTFIVNNITYQYSGGKWKNVSIGSLLSSASINTLNDVDTATATPTDGQTLVWDSAQGKWIPGTISASGGTTTGKAIAMAIVFGG